VSGRQAKALLYAAVAVAHGILYLLLLSSILPVPESDAALTLAVTLVAALSGFGGIFWPWVNFWVLGAVSIMAIVISFFVNVGAFAVVWACSQLQASMDGVSPLE